jgi:hypothetical protein
VLIGVDQLHGANDSGKDAGADPTVGGLVAGVATVREGVRVLLLSKRKLTGFPIQMLRKPGLVQSSTV